MTLTSCDVKDRPLFRDYVFHIYINNFRIKDNLSHCKKLTSFITVLTKACIVKTMVFPVVMYRFESWTIKKAECQRTDDFKLWCWRRLLRVPWTARRSNQSIPKEINRDYSLEELIEAESLIPWPPEMKSRLVGKDPDTGQD